ncbi:hypothetical protein LEP1GSC068_2221 [Leptospira sp. Fiocruz LV3954]|nr:hypothetical protein LEP1GSC068_2221 [Leptospira sp. Fiocruz LV3954]
MWELPRLKGTSIKSKDSDLTIKSLYEIAVLRLSYNEKSIL